MEQKLKGYQIAALAADGFKKVELTVRMYALVRRSMLFLSGLAASAGSICTNPPAEWVWTGQ